MIRSVKREKELTNFRYFLRFFFKSWVHYGKSAQGKRNDIDDFRMD